MSRYERPRDIARSFAQSSDRRRRSRNDAYRRVTFSLPREAAREKAREMFRRYPKAAYMTAIESWRELPDGGIEFTMRRLPTAD
jgi:hypothetical protein